MPERVIPIEDGKCEHHHWVLPNQISLDTIFQLELIILIFWTKFAQNEYFWSKTEKLNITIEFYIFELVWVPNFTLNNQSWNLDQIYPKRVFSLEKEKSEHQRWVLHIRISLATKFQLKLTILIFWTKFLEKGYFRSKTEKVNTTIEFCIFELVWVPNFSLS